MNITNKADVIICNEEVQTKIKDEIGKRIYLLMVVKKHNLGWYGHISRASGMTKTILLGGSKRKKTERTAEKKVGRQHK